MLPIVLAVEFKVLPTTDEVNVSFSFLIFSDILLPGLNLLTQSRYSPFQSPTFWKLVKGIEPLKGVDTPAFIVHIHWGWIIFDAHPKCKSVKSPLDILERKTQGDSTQQRLVCLGSWRRCNQNVACGLRVVWKEMLLKCCRKYVCVVRLCFWHYHAKAPKILEMEFSMQTWDRKQKHNQNKLKIIFFLN
jgi:hypothetical protein